MLSSLSNLIRATKRTSSLTYARLVLLGCFSRPHVGGTFQFPFGPVTYLDAENLRGQYLQMFVNKSLEVDNIACNPIIIDCGGNIGLSAIWFTQRYPGAKVTVFEADPSVAKVLIENVRRLDLGTLDVVCAAAADTTGQVTFSPDGADGGRVIQGKGDVTVASIRLSDFISTPVDILKMDIEGSEYDVIADLVKTGKMSLVKNMVSEIHVKSDTQMRVATLLGQLGNAGFRVAISQADLHPRLPGGDEFTPFSALESGKYLLQVYAWRAGDEGTGIL